ncbi:MAG: aminotransferase class IV [Balneolaceae bacterium]|nr:aminotransferase class IV [Balneolaceae bacterium]
MNDQEKKWIIANGEYEYASTPLLPLESRAVRYGDGCFETFRSYKEAFLELQDHIDRLKGALAYLEIPSTLALDRESIKDQVHSLLRKNNLADEEAVVRLQVWRDGSRGFAIPSDANTGYSISVSTLPDIARSCFAMHRCNPPNSQAGTGSAI